MYYFLRALRALHPSETLEGPCLTSPRPSATPLSPSSALQSPAPILGLFLSKPQRSSLRHAASIFPRSSFAFFLKFFFLFLIHMFMPMKGEDKHHHRLLSFHFHMPQLVHGHEKRMRHPAAAAAMGPPRKGWMGIRVGQDGEEQQRFVVPVDYLKHPLFVGLLDQAEEEYGFQQKGAITIPCGVDHFRRVQGIIDHETIAAHHHLPLLDGCFRA